MKLSAQTARDLEPGGVLKDHVIKGLELEAHKGVKSWNLRYRIGGQRRNPKLGEYPTIGVDAARELAREWHLQIARGNDPSRERSAYVASPTVADLSRLWLAGPCKRKDKPRTLEEKQRRAKLHIVPRLGRVKVADAKLSDIDSALDAIADGSGETVARHCRSDLSGMFRFAEHDDNRWRERHTNPVRDAQNFTKPRRRRHIEAGEGPAIARELDKLALVYPHRVVALWTILYAGTRITELITAKRSQLVGNQIILAADDPHNKTGRTGEERVITLPAQPLAMILDLADDGSGYLFGQGVTRHNVFTVWDKARLAAGCPDLRMQDFRRTFASAAKSAGRDLDTVGELFGHRERETMQAYAWLFDEAAASAAQDTANELEKRMRG
jgi:site-specific recombinase XerD